MAEHKIITLLRHHRSKPSPYWLYMVNPSLLADYKAKHNAHYRKLVQNGRRKLFQTLCTNKIRIRPWSNDSSVLACIFVIHNYRCTTGNVLFPVNSGAVERTIPVRRKFVRGRGLSGLPLRQSEAKMLIKGHQRKTLEGKRERQFSQEENCIVQRQARAHSPTDRNEVEVCVCQAQASRSTIRHSNCDARITVPATMLNDDEEERLKEYAFTHPILSKSRLLVHRQGPSTAPADLLTTGLPPSSIQFPSLKPTPIAAKEEIAEQATLSGHGKQSSMLKQDSQCQGDSLDCPLQPGKPDSESSGNLPFFTEHAFRNLISPKSSPILTNEAELRLSLLDARPPWELSACTAASALPSTFVLSRSKDQSNVEATQIPEVFRGKIHDHNYPDMASNSHRSPEKGGLVKWQQSPSVRLCVEGLPSYVRTVDIHKAFKGFGHVVFIDILKSRDWGTFFANVELKPPPKRNFWCDRSGIEITFVDGSVARHRVNLSSKQPESFRIISPVRLNVSYPQELTLNLSSIDFGVLNSPNAMTPMVTRRQKDGLKPEMILNLRRRAIEIRFPSCLGSDNVPATRLYRFFVALDDKFDIWALNNNGNIASLVINVLKPPRYSRKLAQQIAQSHAANTWRWSEEDLWTRQTDIVSHKNLYDLIDRTPVSVRKNMNAINIARWTTFKLNVEPSNRNLDTARVIYEALRDFNIEIDSTSGFTILSMPNTTDAVIWNSMDEKGGSLMDLMVENLELPFPVRYQVEVCISQGWLSEYALTEEFLRKLKQADHKAKQILLHVDEQRRIVHRPLDIFADLRFSKPVKEHKIPEGNAEIRHATVTATTVIFYSSLVEPTNRVIRKYKHHADRFLRVTFEDDEYRGQTRLFAATNNKMDLIFRRVKRTMRYGIRLGDVHYEFLAWGNSQIREHSAYFFAGIKDGLSASKIRAEMGAFDNEKVVAKRAARMGQCFSTTKAIHLKLPPVTLRNAIPDIVRGKYTFTDGVGMISDFAARIVHHQLKISGPVPSVFQFRLGGCKGILALAPELPNIDVKIRPSQFKFNSLSGELEIIRGSEFWQACTNRQLILVLSHLGVPREVFLQKQQSVIDAVNGAMVDNNIALRALRDTVDPNRMTLDIAELISAGFMNTKEPFVASLLQLWRAWTLKYLKEKAKIPIAKGALVLGCVDETGTLRGHFDHLKPAENASREEMQSTLPEVFIQITDPQTAKRRVIEGICAIARNPSLHPGDIRVVKAVNVPRLHHLCDALVMPQTGDRDLSSMCSGGDLDGDDYVVFWDEDLIPRHWNAEPFHYDAPTPKTAEKEITTEDIIDFFYDYMKNDFLGRIATAHLARADDNGEPDHGLESRECLDLVQLHSLAVDFPKTGVPAILERGQEPIRYPHFMERRTSYKSYDVLGQMYDAVEKTEFKPMWTDAFDLRILDHSKPTKEMLETVEDLKASYDKALQRIMAQYQIKTEFEVWSTFILSHSKASRDYKFHEEIGQLSKSLKDQHREGIVNMAGEDDFQHLAPWAVAAYDFTRRQLRHVLRQAEAEELEPSPKGMPFISFPWLLRDVLLKIVTLPRFNGAYDDGEDKNLCDDSQPTGQSEESKVPNQAQNPGENLLNVEAPPKASNATDFLQVLALRQNLSGTDGELIHDPNDGQQSTDKPGSGADSPAHVSKDSVMNSQIAGLAREEQRPIDTLAPTDFLTDEANIRSPTNPFSSGILRDPASLTEEQQRATGFWDDAL